VCCRKFQQHFVPRSVFPSFADKNKMSAEQETQFFFLFTIFFRAQFTASTV
jgi:hypothetical protein